MPLRNDLSRSLAAFEQDRTLVGYHWRAEASRAGREIDRINRGRLPELVFQKSFNSMAKRHHIRLWEVESPDGPVWLGAATHDISIAFDWKRLVLTHRIDPSIDRERDKVLADLTFAGCVATFARVERPALAVDSNRITTDGALHLIDPRQCQQSVVAADSGVGRKKTPLGKAMLRRTILESRQYLLRGNGYYWAYRGLRSGPVRALFSKPKATLAGLRPEVGKTCWRCGSGSARCGEPLTGRAGPTKKVIGSQRTERGRTLIVRRCGANCGGRTRGSHR